MSVNLMFPLVTSFTATKGSVQRGCRSPGQGRVVALRDPLHKELMACHQACLTKQL